MRLLQRFIPALFIFMLIFPAMVLADGKIVAKPLLIDVRTEAEWNEGHLEGAILIPYEKIGGEIAKVAPDKKTKIDLYCRTGRRSGIALDTLKKLGYENTINHGTLKEASDKLKIPVVK